MPQTLNAKGKPFTWSYSALNDYENCPKRYAHARFYCDSPFRDSEALRWGYRVHRAGELFLQGRNPDDDEALKPVEPYVTAMLRSGHFPEAELAITLTEDFRTTTWWAEDAWLRVKIDVVLTKAKTTALLYDYKTGATIRDDPAQLKLCAAVLSTVRPHLEHFEGKYIWTAHKTTTGIDPVVKNDVPKLWGEFLPIVARMQQAWDNDHFPAKPSGLCPWCPVNNCRQRRGARR